MFNRFPTCRQWNAQLDQIMTMYTKVLTDLLPVEEPLSEDRIQRMDTDLSPGLTNLKWRSEDATPDFIECVCVVELGEMFATLMRSQPSSSRTLLSLTRSPAS